MIIIPNECDILGQGKEDDECNCNQDNLFKIAESLFLAKDYAKLGIFVGEVIDNCVGNSTANTKAKGPKKKRPPSAYNNFMSEYMKGCGKEDKDSCSETMKKGAAEWQEKKKQEGK